jgi:hypothetical protein
MIKNDREDRDGPETVNIRTVFRMVGAEAWLLHGLPYSSGLGMVRECPI